MRTLVVIVTYNGMRWLPGCLGSVAPYDALVVDNGSTDGSADWIRANHPEAKLIESGENLGFGKANNIGFEYALANGYDYVYLLNQDARLFPDTIPSLIAASLANPGYGILSPLQLEADGATPDSNFRKKCGRALAGAGGKEVVEVDFVMAAHWLIPTAALLQIGGFSPAFPHYGEDDDLVHRARYKGFKAGVVPAAKAVHDRQNRPRSRKLHMWQKYTTAVSRIVDPQRCFPIQAVLQPLSMPLFCLRYLTILPLGHMKRLIEQLPGLRRIREESKAPGAFLQINQV